MIARVLVAGGGTGGHLFPGLAVVEELRRRLPAVDILFVGTERGLEARLLPERGERFHAIPAAPLVRVGARRFASSVLALPRAGAQALGVVMSFRPDLVLGLGGYASGPVLAAAAALRVPTALLEQNVHVGLTNRLLARTVGRAYLTYEETAALFGPERARTLGNPVRRALLEAAHQADHDPAGLEARARNVLVLGGSQGAKVLNESVPEALARAGVTGHGFRVVHQTGEAMRDAVRSRYAALGVEAEVVSFIDDMARAYAKAALVIGRAGATTIAELCAVGRPSLLIPLPTAAEDHQSKNARALAEAGAAVVVAEADVGGERLRLEVEALLADRARRVAMATAARRLGRPDAAAAIVDDLFEWLGVSVAGGGGGDAPDAGTDAGVETLPTTTQGAAGTRRRAKVTRAELRLRTVDDALEAGG